MVAVSQILVLDQWLLWLSGLSVVMFFVTLLALPFVILRLPEDFFTRLGEPSVGTARLRSKKVATLLLRNLIGWLLIAAGFLMLFLPGQGILTMVLGLTLIQLPGKRRLYQWVLKAVNTRPLFEKMNGLRRHFKRPPLQPPPARER